MENIKDFSFATRCIHAGTKDNPEGAVVTPIYQTSTFKFDNADQGAELFSGSREGYIYTRMRNPTIEAMEDSIAALEGGVKALGCGSGMAAISTLFMATVKSGDHIVCSDSCYGPTTTLLSTILTHLDIETTFVDSSDTQAVADAVKDNTKLIYIETPANPTLVISDLGEIAKIAKSHNIKLAVDNTFMSPALQNPFELGADYIIHSMTKFLNGHADVVAGIIVLKDIEDYPHFRKILNHFGGTIDPFNSFLVHRGVKTLSIRMQRHSENARVVAKFLEAHQKIEWVRYPGLESHPQYAIGKKQHKDTGGMIAFELKGGVEAGRTMMDNVEICQLAVSLGGVESLIEHPASMTHAGMSRESREKANITDGLVRLSVGIEDVNELIKGLEAGLDKIQ